MRGVNKVILIGNLGKDPEVRSTKTGTPVTTLSVATTDNWEKDGNRQERTEWHTVICWGKLADIAGQHLSKGRQVYIEGRLQTREWADNSGNKRKSTEIVAKELVFLGAPEQKQENLQDAIFANAPPRDDSEENF